MSKGSRYDTSGLIEDMYEPGSRRRVLKNKLGITRKRVLDEVEAREQLRALHEFLDIYDREHRFSAHGRYFQGCFGKVPSAGAGWLMRSIRICSASRALLAAIPMPSTALDDKIV